MPRFQCSRYARTAQEFYADEAHVFHVKDSEKAAELYIEENWSESDPLSGHTVFVRDEDGEILEYDVVVMPEAYATLKEQVTP